MFVRATAVGARRNFCNGGQPGGLGTEVPQRGPGAEPRRGLEAKPPEADGITGCAVAKHCCNDDQQSQWENGDFDPL